MTEPVWVISLAVYEKMREIVMSQSSSVDTPVQRMYREIITRDEARRLQPKINWKRR